MRKAQEQTLRLRAGLSEQPHSQSDPETEYDSHTDVPDSRERRRLRHKTPVSPRFSTVGSEKEGLIPALTDCSMPAFAEIIEEVRPVAGSICSVGVEGNPLLVSLDSVCPPSETEPVGHEHTVQLLTEDCTDRDTQGVDTAQLSALFGAGDTTTKSCQHRKLLVLSTVADVQWNPSSMRTGQRRNLSSMTKMFATITAAAEHLQCARLLKLSTSFWET